MTYYRFSTFTTSYYFPEISEETQFLYGLYSPYGGKLSRFYWQKFRQSQLVRRLTAVKEMDLPFPYDIVRGLVGDEAILSFNMGSPGSVQKISILGYNPQTRQKIFAKFSQKSEAMQLSRHEIEVLHVLQETGLTPRLYNSKVEENYVYLQTEYVQGHRPYDTLMNEHVVDILILLAGMHYPDAVQNEEGLRTCLSHGDFCPWNLLVQEDGSLRMIDWEMAGERIVGYDLFTWLLNVAGLVMGNMPLHHIIEKNRKHIMRYFNAMHVSDYTPYLRCYVERRMEALREKNRKDSLLTKYKELYDML